MEESQLWSCLHSIDGLPACTVSVYPSSFLRFWSGSRTENVKFEPPSILLSSFRLPVLALPFLLLSLSVVCQLPLSVSRYLPLLPLLDVHCNLTQHLQPCVNRGRATIHVFSLVKSIHNPNELQAVGTRSWRCPGRIRTRGPGSPVLVICANCEQGSTLGVFFVIVVHCPLLTHCIAARAAAQAQYPAVSALSFKSSADSLFRIAAGDVGLPLHSTTITTMHRRRLQLRLLLHRIAMSPQLLHGPCRAL